MQDVYKKDCAMCARCKWWVGACVQLLPLGLAEEEPSAAAALLSVQPPLPTSCHHREREAGEQETHYTVRQPADTAGDTGRETQRNRETLDTM